MKRDSIRKFTAALLAVMLCLLCVVALVACNKDAKVTFVYGNGQPNSVVSVKDGRIEEPTQPERSGYTFLYWSLQGKNTAFDFDTAVKSNIVLVAQWKEISQDITVTYVYDNGDTDLVRPIVGGTVTEPIAPNKDGFIFLFWSLQGEDEAFDFSTQVTESIVLVANWADNTQITVTYVYGNGQSDRTLTVVDGKVTEPAAPKRDEYEFKFWALRGEDTAFDFSSTVTESIILEAKWEQIGVTFKYGNGLSDNKVTVYNQTVDKPTENPTRYGYKFVYWTLEGEDEPFDFNTVITHSISLTAKWHDGNIVTLVYVNGQANRIVLLASDEKLVQPQTPVRDGYTFLYWALESSDTPYNFDSIVEDDIVIVAIWQQQIAHHVILHWMNDESARFVFEESKPNSVPENSTVSFRVKPSPYFVGTPIVSVGTTVLQAQDGVYSFVANEELTITVTGLVRDNTPIQGKGTEYNPYIITTPMQLKTITDSINNISDTTYNFAYIVLGADLDFDGEKLVAIGNDLYVNTMFSGTFDGNGHTISNFELSNNDLVAGLFGFIQNATIKNLNIATDLDIVSSDNAKFVGGVVGYSFGSDITGCTFNGSITVVNGISPDDATVVAGGIVGYMQGNGSTYSDGYSSSVSYCSVNVRITTEGNSDLTAIGGIAGIAYGLSAFSPTNVFNCAAEVNFGGSTRRAGGIVGLLRELSSIDNCIAVGSISTSTEDIEYINAKGGIVGEAYNENCITYSLSRIADYAIVGRQREAGVNNVDDRETLTVNNVTANSTEIKVGDTTYSLGNFDDVMSLMDWNTAEWQSVNGRILPKAENASGVTINLTFKFGSTYNEHDEVTFAEMIDSAPYGYFPLGFVFDGDGLNTLTADNGLISFGFFLDEALTVRVPASFLLTSHETVIYVGFEDYSNIAGEYYTAVGNHDIKLLFDANGKMTMISEGKVANYMYVYDGKKLVIHDAYFVYLKYNVSGRNAYFDFIADIEQNGSQRYLRIYDGTFFTTTDPRYPAITACMENGVIGKWYTRGQALVYTFNADGTGTISNGNAFTYTVLNKSVTIEQGSTKFTAILSADGRTIMATSDAGITLSITQFDAFSGIWESDYNNRIVFDIDGVNTITVNGEQYAYTIEDGELVANAEGGLFAYFNDNGMLVVSYGDKTFVCGREGSFIGVWQDPGIDYQLILYGINKDGYGTGIDSYGYSITYTFERMAGSSQIGDGSLMLYYRTSSYGFGESHNGLEVGDTLLALAIQTPGSGMMVDDYNLSYVDIFYGSWNSAEGISLSFNGNGAYDIDMTTSDGMVWQVQGFVEVAENGEKQSVRYTYDRATASASFTYKGVRYTVIRNGDLVVAKGGSEDILFATPDELSENSWYTVGMNKITFDGRGNIGGGSVTIEFADGNQTFDYTINGDTVVISNDTEVVYTVDINAKKIYNATDALIGDLGKYSAILGRNYAIQGSDLTFECTQLFDKNGEATGKFGEFDVMFLYVSDDIISVYSVYGTLLYFLSYYDEETVLVADSSGVAVAVAFIPDALMGVYFNSDKSVRLEIDGASNNSYTHASATFYPINQSGAQIDDDQEFVYFEENGIYGIYTAQRQEDGSFEYTLVYSISEQEVEGAVKYTTADNSKSIWIVEA